MDQYPKWFLALNFPNVLIAAILMIFFMFGGIHPFGNVDSTMGSFLIYILNQIFWIAPILLFFASILSWGWAREKSAIAMAVAGWVINLVSLYIVISA